MEITSNPTSLKVHKTMANQIDTGSVSIIEIVNPIRKELAEVESILKRELTSDSDDVSKMLKHPMFWSGKRVRPILLLLAADLAGEISQRHTVLAAAIEMVHVATLVHDDILDDAKTRRHASSVNQEWGNHLSVLLGDFLFSHAYYLASSVNSVWACQQISQATNRLVAGEIEQINNQGNFQITEKEYFQIIDGKTGSLCECATSLGGVDAHRNSETISRLQSIGNNYGLAFQIVDDILDLQGTESVVGKSLGSDLNQLKLTLPMIFSLSQLDQHQRSEIVERLQNQQMNSAKVVEFISQQGGFQYALQSAESLVRNAQRTIQGFPDSPSKESMLAIGEFVLSRDS